MGGRIPETQETSRPAIGRAGNLSEEAIHGKALPKARDGAIAHVRRNDDGTWAEPQGLKDGINEVDVFWAIFFLAGNPSLSVNQHIGVPCGLPS